MKTIHRRVPVVARARRHDLSAAVVLVDLDKFKKVNDVHGCIENSNHFFSPCTTVSQDREVINLRGVL